MHKNYKDSTVRSTARIKTELYNRVVNKLHYGQITVLLTKFFISLDLLIKNGQFDKVVLYLNGVKELTLPIEKEN